MVCLSVLSATIYTIFMLSASRYNHISVSNSPPSLRNPATRGRVLVVRYSGQQGAGVVALSSLQRWVRDVRLPMMIVEPFLQQSVIGNRQLSASGPSVRFSDMFDLEHFNEVSRSEGAPEIIDWSTYIANGPHKAVFVDMVSNGDRQASTELQVTWTAATSDGCWPSRVPKLMKNVSLCVLRTVKGYWNFMSTRILSADDVYNTVLDGLDPTELTLVFSLWRGPWTITHSKRLSSVNSLIRDAAEDNRFQDSSRLHVLAENYKRFFKNASDPAYVAVMLRAEHSVIEFQKMKNANVMTKLNQCMQKVVQTTHVAMKTVGSSNLLVTADVGNYGSGSWNRTLLTGGGKGDVSVIQQRVERAVERLHDERLSFQEWEQSFSVATGGVKESGYVAALQRVLASEAACLVLLGGGRFQQLTLANYLQRNHTHCVHLVCMERKYLVSFQSMLEGSEAVV